MSCQGFHQHTGFLAMTNQPGNYSSWCPRKGDVESIWAVESLAQGRNTHILPSACHALPATWQAHVQIHGTTCPQHTCRRYAGDTSGSMQADLSSEASTPWAWACLCTCTPTRAPDGDRLKDDKHTTSRGHIASGMRLVLQPHFWGTWDRWWWLIKGQVSSVTEVIHSPVLWHTTNTPAVPSL